jgi:hypothetical protein
MADEIYTCQNCGTMKELTDKEKAIYWERKHEESQNFLWGIFKQLGKHFHREIK